MCFKFPKWRKSRKADIDKAKDELGTKVFHEASLKGVSEEQLVDAFEKFKKGFNSVK
jgi:hypothetical protein